MNDIKENTNRKEKEINIIVDRNFITAVDSKSYYFRILGKVIDFIKQTYEKSKPIWRKSRKMLEKNIYRTIGIMRIEIDNLKEEVETLREMMNLSRGGENE